MALEPVLGPNPRTGVLDSSAKPPPLPAPMAAVAPVGDEVRSLVAGEKLTFWAFRRILEALARERPVVLVMDDVHL